MVAFGPQKSQIILYKLNYINLMFSKKLKAFLSSLLLLGWYATDNSVICDWSGSKLDKQLTGVVVLTFDVVCCLVHHYRVIYQVCRLADNCVLPSKHENKLLRFFHW